MKPLKTSLQGLGVLLLAFTISACSDTTALPGPTTPPVATSDTITTKTSPTKTSTPTNITEVEPEPAEEVEEHIDAKAEPFVASEAAKEEVKAPIKKRPSTKFDFSEDGKSLIQKAGDTTTTLEGPGDWIAYYATFSDQSKNLLAIFGGAEGRNGTTKMAIYSDKNADGLYDTKERISSFDLGAGELIQGAGFLDNGEMLYLDGNANEIRRIVDGDGDGTLDALSPKVYWSATKDKKFTGFQELRAKTTSIVHLRNPETNVKYVVRDYNADGVGDEGKTK